MANVLNVPHFPQTTDGLCLPACAQMVLTYLGVACSQSDLARQLGTRPNIGTPHSRIMGLRSLGVQVTYAAGGDLNTLRNHLEHNLPVIVFVQAAELPHWREHKSRHALVVIGIDENAITILDPAASSSPISIPPDDFMLAWDEADNTFAVIARPA